MGSRPNWQICLRCKKGRKIIMLAAKNAGGVQLRTQSTQITQPHHHAEATGNTATTAPSVAARTIVDIQRPPPLNLADAMGVTATTIISVATTIASIIIAEITQRRMITQLVGTRPDVGCPRKNLTRTKKSRRREKTMTKIGMRSTTKRLRRTEFRKPTHCSRSMGNWDARLLPFAGLK